MEINTKGKSIAIFTWYRGNYGTCLQAFALFKFFEKKGANVYMIGRVNKATYLNPLKAYGPKYFLTIVKYKIRKILKKKQNLITNNYADLISRKKKDDEEFINSYIKVWNIMNKRDYKSFFDTFSCLVSGSDQILNPYVLETKGLFDFAYGKAVKRFTYASSLGVASIPENTRRIYAHYLPLFDGISVREETGKKLLQPFTDKEIIVVVDPTLLLEKEDYLEIMKSSKYFDKCFDSIVCYFVGNNKAYLDYCVRLGKKLGKKVVILPQKESDFDERFYIAADASVTDFLCLIRNAHMVITDSFHATIFSIIFEKDFFALPRFDKNDITSQNSRLLDLLERLDIQERYVENLEQVEISKKLNYEKIKERIDISKRESLEYLNKILLN